MTAADKSCRQQTVAVTDVVSALKSKLLYDRETGQFVWISGHRAGKVAGRILVRGYRTLRCDGQEYLEHRLAWLFEHERWPHEQIDHINRIKADNRIVNLRECSGAQNSANTPWRGNAAGYRGVYLYKRSKRFRAEIKVNRKKINLGLFDTALEASLAYEAACRRIFGEFAHNYFDPSAAPANPRRFLTGAAETLARVA